jgi:uncharacterized protein YbjT (DUF2867 family)
MSKTTNKFSPEVCERAVRMVLENQGQHDSRWSTIAAAAGVKLVLQTAMGVNASEEIPYRKLERLVEKSAAPYVILRPNWFLDNFHHFWFKGMTEYDLVAVPAGNAKTSFIDVRDIADAATVALTSADFDGQALTLTGSESLSYAKEAGVLSQVLGRTIRYEAVDTEGFVAHASKIGFSGAQAEMLASIFYPVSQGWQSADTGEVARLTGRQPRRMVDYIADNAGRFQ